MKVVYTERAYDSLDALCDFLLLAQKWKLNKVQNLVDSLIDKAESLATSYNQHQIEEHLVLLGKNHRRVIIGQYKIIYRVEKECIYITDFFDTRQDPEKMAD